MLFKESGVYAWSSTEFETDTGYAGITAIHSSSILPKKRRKKTPLTEETTASFLEKESM